MSNTIDAEGDKHGWTTTCGKAKTDTRVPGCRASVECLRQAKKETDRRVPAAAPLLNAYVRRKKKQRGRGLLGVLGGAAKIGVRLGKDKRYKRMGVKGATGSYNRRPAPWEV